MPTIDVAGSTVFYREFGDPAKPALIVLHGLYADSSSVVPLADEFTERFHVIAPDALGHGRSSHPAAFTLQDQGRMLNSFVAELTDAPDRTAVVGVSMGSYIAAQAAILEPQRVSNLILVVSKAHGTTSSTVAYARRMGFDLSTMTQEEILALLDGAVWSPRTPQWRRDEIMTQSSGEQVELSPDERAAVDGSLAGFDLRPGLPSITARTLVLAGRDDGLNPPESGREVAELIPGARFEVYEDSGHLLPYEEKDRFVADVTEFALG